jgi:hypothetical protein
MNEIIRFIEDFHRTEYELTTSRFKLDISDEEQENMCNEKMSLFFHSLINSSISHYLRGKNDLSDKSLLVYKKPERVQKRILFQIKEYKDPDCGEVIKRYIQGNSIFLCYTSEDEINEDDGLQFSRVFVVADTDEGLKILYYYFYNKGRLEQMHDYEPEYINNPGKLIKVNKLQAPEEEISLSDYNAG